MNLAYVAGLIDGEGCLGFTKSGKCVTPRITITNTDKDVLNDLKESFGGHIVFRASSKSNWKPCGHWVIQNKIAIDFLDKIFRFLRIKRNQAICLFLHDCIRPGKGSKWSQESLEAFQLIRDQLTWLNKKGIHELEEPMRMALCEAY